MQIYTLDIIGSVKYETTDIMKKIVLTFPLMLAVIFPVLFHRQQAGINVLLFDIALLAMVWYAGRPDFRNRLFTVVFTGVALSGLMVFMYGSVMALTVNIISLIVLAGLLAAPYLSVLLNGFFTSAMAVFTGPVEYLRALGIALSAQRGLRKSLRYAGFIVVPVVIFIVFVSMYSAASPYFNRYTGNFMHFLNEIFTRIFSVVEPEVLFIALAGLITGMVVLYGRRMTFFDLPAETGDIELRRTRRQFEGTAVALKTEARTAVVLFTLLNVALLVMNALDFYHVWINFEWDGGFLKQFVHEGTWLLINSIIISMVLVLWYFRGNLNFYPGKRYAGTHAHPENRNSRGGPYLHPENRRSGGDDNLHPGNHHNSEGGNLHPVNRLLLWLAGIWIAQNAFLTLSVGIRNFWYVHYFNLAYKRIWVFAFLILVFIGLVTVYIKVSKRKSLRYLLIQNSLFAYILFVALSFVNWDMVIARFNLSRAHKAFFHTDFMVTLDSNTLPVLLLDEPRLTAIKEAQSTLFTYDNNYLPFTEYNNRLLERKKHYLEGYPQLQWPGWNVADYRTYLRLRGEVGVP